MRVGETIRAFDAHLAEAGLEFHAVVLGGTAMALLNLIDRETRDCDVLVPEIPDDIAAAAQEFARRRTAAGHRLAEDWLNNGPASMAEFLPDGWRERVVPAYRGAALALDVVGRLDLLRTRLLGLCDRGTDLPDCLAMAPTAGELEEAAQWVAAYDGNPQWPDHVREMVAEVARRLGHV